MTTNATDQVSTNSRIFGESEMAERVRKFQWDTTALGPIHGWNSTLLASVNLMLGMRFPAMLMWGPEMVMLYNDAFAPVLTNRHPVGLGARGREFWSDVWPVVGEQLEGVLSKGAAVFFEAAHVPLLRNGAMQDAWFSYSYSPAYDADGSIHGLFVVCEDITKSIIAERQRETAQSALNDSMEALSKERSHLLNILHQAPVFFALLHGPNHVVTMANQLYLKLVGYRNILDRTIAEALPEVIEQGYVDLLDRVFTTGEAFAQQGALVDISPAEGLPPEPRFLDFSYQPLRESDGTISGIIVLGVDQTDAKQSEKALLHNEKLAAVGRLASSIAHEINNPLESVTNLIYLARSSDMLPQIQEYLETAELELRRIGAITHQTLSFHKLTTAPRAITVHDLLNSALNIYQSRIRNSNVELLQRLRSKRTVVCLEGEIRQVLNNLIVNAIDAMPTGGNLMVRSRDVASGIVITIADSGNGIAPENLRRIFEPFYTTKGIGGTGLGLWLSRDIITRHRGSMRVRSNNGLGHRGTVFTLFLPLDATPRE